MTQQTRQTVFAVKCTSYQSGYDGSVCSSSHTVKVFSTNQKAETFVAAQKSGEWCDYEVEEVEFE